MQFSTSISAYFINAAFWELIKQNIVLLYLDDIIILAENEQEALLRLRLVLETASEYGLQLNLKKCQFIKKSVEFLGHIVEGGQYSRRSLSLFRKS